MLNLYICLGRNKLSAFCALFVCLAEVMTCPHKQATLCQRNPLAQLESLLHILHSTPAQFFSLALAQTI